MRRQRLLAGTVIGLTAIVSASVGLVVSGQNRSAPSWTGSVLVNPDRVTAGGWTTLRFVFEAGERGIHGGALALSVPSGWTPPSRSPAKAGRVTSSVGTVNVRGRTIRVEGISLSPGSTLTVSYGGGSAGATEPTRVGRYAFMAAAMGASSGLTRGAGSALVEVTMPAHGCRATVHPGPPGWRLRLVNGVAQANLHNVRAFEGNVEQCYGASGLSTSVALANVLPSGAGPAGFPEVAYGYDLYGQAFCDSCHSQPFPLPVREVGEHDYRLSVDYVLGTPTPSSLPIDFIYDLWLEPGLAPGIPPGSGDVEMLIFIYQQQMASCVPDRPAATFSTIVKFRGRRVSSEWRVCQIYGGTAATPVAFFLQDPAQAKIGALSLSLGDFLREAGRYLGSDLRGLSVMGVELGGEFDQCISGVRCQSPDPRWQWQVSGLTLSSSSAHIPIVFTGR